MSSDNKSVNQVVRSRLLSRKKGQSLHSGLHRQKGAAAIEYAVIAALIVVALWGAVEALDLGPLLSRIFEQIRDALTLPDAG